MKGELKRIEFSNHARVQMAERGAEEQEVIEAILNGEQVPAKRGRQGYRKNFQYNQMWGGQTYAIKQVFPGGSLVVTFTSPSASGWFRMGWALDEARVYVEFSER